jgi:hypothetical protein
MVNELDLVVSVTEVAVTVTEVFEVTVAGAVYVTGLPVVALNVPPPVTVQVTPLPDESLATVAAMLRVCPWSIACAALGDTVTEIAGGVTGGVLALEPHPYTNPKPRSVTSRTAFIFGLAFKEVISWGICFTNNLRMPGRGDFAWSDVRADEPIDPGVRLLVSGGVAACFGNCSSGRQVTTPYHKSLYQECDPGHICHFFSRRDPEYAREP